MFTFVCAFFPAMGCGGRYFASTAPRFYDAQGKVVGAIEAIRDITAGNFLSVPMSRWGLAVGDPAAPPGHGLMFLVLVELG
jgi:hypothetical protein